MPGELLVIVLHLNPEEAGSNIGQHSSEDELASESEGEQVKSQVFFSVSVWTATRECGSD